MDTQAVLSRWAQLSDRLARHRPLVLLGAAMLAFFAVVLSQRHYVPIWDSWIYANCVEEAAAHPLQLERYGCAGHFSHAYVFLLASSHWLGLPGMRGILLVNAMLGMRAIAALYGIARAALPGESYRLDCAILASAWAFHPIFFASAVFVNIDFGVLVFGLITLSCLLRNQTYPTAVFGLLLVFSKEVGCLVYAIFLICYLVFFVGRVSATPNRKIALVMRLWPLTLPFLAILIYFLGLRPATVPLWGNADAASILDQLTTVRLLAPETAAALSGIFVLNFSWLSSAVVAADLIHRGFGWCIGRSTRSVEAAHPQGLSCVLWVIVILIFCLTRFQTSVSVRYFAIIYPMLLLACLAAAARLAVPVLLRRTMFGCLTLLFLVSSFRTVDPVSKRIYGSFQFGEHPMLAMTSINHECCGYGIDQLVYNLEFVRVHEALDAALTQLRPSHRRPIMMADATDWYLYVRMDPINFHRTLLKTGSATVPHLDITEWAARAERPREVDFLALATADNRIALQRLQSLYNVTGVFRFGKSGYWFANYRMLLKQ